MRRAASAPAAFVVAMLAVFPAFADEVRLSGPEIESVLTGRTAIYQGGVIKQYFASSGETPYWDGSRLTRGSWRVSGDRYCSVWPPASGWACYDMFGTDNGDIVWVGSGGDRYTAHMEDGNGMPSQ